MSSRLIDPCEAHDLRLRARLAGAELRGKIGARWEVAGGCERPIELQLYGRSRPREYAPAGSVGNGASYVEVSVPCRRCDPCRSTAVWRWARRAQAEMQASARSWLSTFTVRPEQRLLVELEAERIASLKGWDYDQTNPLGDTLKARLYVIGAEYTQYMKRVRYSASRDGNRSLRHLTVFEKHKDGWPHIHALVHEVTRGVLTKATLEAHWKWGHSHHRLTKDRRAGEYVAKYILKDENQARVRASVRYGKALPTELIESSRNEVE